MTPPSWVPKVHPLARPAEADDPYELIAQPVQGDPGEMLECILQEFLWMGWTAEDLHGLFRHPNYPVLRQMREHFTDAEIRRRIAALIARCGVPRFRESIAEPEDVEEDAHEPTLVQIQLPQRSAGG